MKLSATPPNLRQPQLDYVDQRWNQLHELEMKRSDTATNYLFLVSGGASAAVLAFIGNVAKDQVIPQSAVLMLGCFAISLLIVGLLKGAITMHVMAIFKSWQSLVNRYYSDEIGWKAMLVEDSKVVRRFEWLHLLLGWLSFLFLCLGVGIGFFKLQEEVNHGKLEKNIAAVTATAKSSSISAKESPGVDNKSSKRETHNDRSRPGDAATPTSSKKEVKPVNLPD